MEDFIMKAGTRVEFHHRDHGTVEGVLRFNVAHGSEFANVNLDLPNGAMRILLIRVKDLRVLP